MNSTLPRIAFRRGSDQPSASATNETTNTAAAAAPNSVSGIGRSARPTIPWAKRSTPPSLGTRTAPLTRGRSETRVKLEDYEHFASDVLVADGFAGAPGFGA